MNSTNNFKNNLKADIQKLENSINKLADNYSTYTNQFNTEYIQNIAAAIYLEYKRLYPELDFFITFRQKGTKSVQKNISKVLLRDYKASDNRGNKKFERTILKDIDAMKIVLSHVPDTMHFDYNDPKNQEIIKLQKQKISNLNFINNLKDWIYEYSDDSIQNEENFYRYYIELLNRLQESTYDECTDEVEITYKERCQRAIKQYEKMKSDDEFSFFVSDEQMDELKKLLRLSRKKIR